MSSIKDGRYPIMLDKERHLLFSLNVLDELQDRAGDIDRLKEYLYPDGKPNLKNLIWLLTILINEGAEDGEEAITERKVGRLIHLGNFQEVVSTLFKAFHRGNNGDADSTAITDDSLEDDTESLIEYEGKNA